MKLLFLNALKGLRNKKVQMFGIIFMVILSTAVYTGMNSAIDRLENKYYSYLDEQNVEDITNEIINLYNKYLGKETKAYVYSQQNDNFKTDLTDECVNYRHENYRAFENTWDYLNLLGEN